MLEAGGARGAPGRPPGRRARGSPCRSGAWSRGHLLNCSWQLVHRAVVVAYGIMCLYSVPWARWQLLHCDEQVRVARVLHLRRRWGGWSASASRGTGRSISMPFGFLKRSGAFAAVRVVAGGALARRRSGSCLVGETAWRRMVSAWQVPQTATRVPLERAPCSFEACGPWQARQAPSATGWWTPVLVEHGGHLLAVAGAAELDAGLPGLEGRLRGGRLVAHGALPLRHRRVDVGEEHAPLVRAVRVVAGGAVGGLAPGSRGASSRSIGDVDLVAAHAEAGDVALQERRSAAGGAVRVVAGDAALLHRRVLVLGGGRGLDDALVAGGAEVVARP